MKQIAVKNITTKAMVNILVGCTGSVATIKLPILLIDLRQKLSHKFENVKVKMMLILNCV